MSNKPFDFEAERNRMAKELGLTYSDNGKAVFYIGFLAGKHASARGQTGAH